MKLANKDQVKNRLLRYEELLYLFVGVPPMLLNFWPNPHETLISNAYHARCAKFLLG